MKFRPPVGANPSQRRVAPRAHTRHALSIGGVAEQELQGGDMGGDRRSARRTARIPPVVFRKGSRREGRFAPFTPGKRLQTGRKQQKSTPEIRCQGKTCLFAPPWAEIGGVRRHDDNRACSGRYQEHNGRDSRLSGQEQARRSSRQFSVIAYSDRKSPAGAMSSRRATGIREVTPQAMTSAAILRSRPPPRRPLSVPNQERSLRFSPSRRRTRSFRRPAAAGARDSNRQRRARHSRCCWRGTTMSTMPWTRRYSARWNPSGNRSRIVCSITRAPAKPMTAPGSAMCTSPSIA